MILITGFEPFGGEKINTSAEVLRLLPETVAGIPVHKRLLPVVFGEAAETALGELALRGLAEAVFLLGEAGGRETVTPELRARNLRNARIPDNGGNQPVSQPVLAEGPEEFVTPFPVRDIVERMKAEGCAIEVSEDAGAFVCNDTFYLVGLKSGVPADFIHVPHRTENIGELAETVRRFMELALRKMPAEAE